MTRDLTRRLFAEFLGSAFLAIVVLGSGIAAQRLSPGDVGLELFENAAATAVGLFAIIIMFGPVSGGHFNPVVSFVDAAFGGLSWRERVVLRPGAGGRVHRWRNRRQPHVLPPRGDALEQHRASAAHWLAEVVATVGLLLVIFALARTSRGTAAPAAVGAYIGGAYFFTSSTSFANPAIAVGRMFSNTFAGIAPASAPGYIGAEIVGGIVAFAIIKVLYPNVTRADAEKVVVPHNDRRWSPALSADGNGTATSDRVEYRTQNATRRAPSVRDDADRSSD